MKRKFSFDLPRLKLGASKADDRALKEHLAYGVDSPPPTPKSVRPPLDAQTEADLRSACAYVLQNFKPSHVVYAEQHGYNAPNPHLDYAAVKESVHREMEAGAPPLGKLKTRERSTAPDSKRAACGDALEIEAFDPHLYMHEPGAATQNVSSEDKEQRARRVSQQKQAIRRAQNRISPEPKKVPVSGSKLRLPSHSRSASNPVATLAAPKSDIPERPQIAARTKSVETAGSTPETDATEYPWSDKASTAMTSAMVTPARSSKRTSSQAPQSGLDAGSVPKVELIDSEWMRQKLERHKKAQEQIILQQQERAKRDNKIEKADAAVMETTPAQVSTRATQASTPVKQAIARKPVPSSRSRSEQELVVPCADSRNSCEPWRADTKQMTASMPRVASKQDGETPRMSEDIRRTEQNANSEGRARSTTREAKHDFQRGTTQNPRDSGEGSRPESRARAITRQMKELVRPGIAVDSRGPSVEIRRVGGKSRSIDSLRSMASETAPSEASSTSNWRNSRPWHRQQESADFSDVSRPGSSSSKWNFRGRPVVRHVDQSPPQSKSTPLNLNRELPPLPSLDQWKPVDPSPIEKVQEVPELLSSQPRNRSMTAPGPRVGERDVVHFSLTEAPTLSKSHKPSADVRNFSAPILSSASPRNWPTEESDALEILDDVLDDDIQSPIAPTTTLDPVSISANVKKERQASRSNQATSSPEYTERVQNVSVGQVAVQKPFMTGKAQLVNFSRVVAGPTSGNLGRKGNEKDHVATLATCSTPASHLRNNSDHLGASHKLSMDDYNRMHDSRYQNMVEIPANSKAAAVPPVAAPKGRPKQKWWQGKQKREQTWMDQVVKSGSTSGMILTDEVDNAPIVRY